MKTLWGIVMGAALSVAAAEEVKLPPFTNSVGIVVSNAFAVKGLPQGLQYSVPGGGGVLPWEKVPEGVAKLFAPDNAGDLVKRSASVDLMIRGGQILADISATSVKGLAKKSRENTVPVGATNSSALFFGDLGIGDDGHLCVVSIVGELRDPRNRRVSDTTNVTFLTEFGAIESKVTCATAEDGKRVVLVSYPESFSLARAKNILATFETPRGVATLDLTTRLTPSKSAASEVSAAPRQREQAEPRVEIRLVDTKHSHARWSYKITVPNDGPARTVHGDIVFADAKGFAIKEWFQDKTTIPRGGATLTGTAPIELPAGTRVVQAFFNPVWRD